jgi:hypothetical protein
MFCRPCIVIYPYNKNQQDANMLSNYFNNELLHVSSRLTAHHQEVLLDVTLTTYCPFVSFYANEHSFILSTQLCAQALYR